jgi:hypothetical protein
MRMLDSQQVRLIAELEAWLAPKNEDEIFALIAVPLERSWPSARGGRVAAATSERTIGSTSLSFNRIVQVGRKLSKNVTGFGVMIMRRYDMTALLPSLAR